MVITCTWENQRYTADLSDPLSIAIPLRNGIEQQPNAFAAPPYESHPYREGNFVGALAHGAPVNFFNVRINPHGNGTHTECVGHIMEGPFFIDPLLNEVMLVAELVSIYPTLQENGDQVITATTLSALSQASSEALIVRTLPNNPDKSTRHYNGTNPAYFTTDAISWMGEHGIRHLLTDLPSIDPENDGGALEAHKMFWEVSKTPRSDKTITEMVFVDNNVEDGLYLLSIQIAPLALDVSPSRPLLFRMKPI